LGGNHSEDSSLRWRADEAVVRAHPESWNKDKLLARCWRGKSVAESGAVLTLDYDGDLVIERGLTAKADGPRPEAAGRGKPAGDPSGLSASLAEYLTVQKTAAIRAELAQSPSVALAAVVHALALKVFYHGGGTCLEISTRLNSLKSSIKNADSKALATLDAERDRWQDRLPGECADLWDWCLGQKQTPFWTSWPSAPPVRSMPCRRKTEGRTQTPCAMPTIWPGP
jgi:hypothetical protein